MSIYKKALLLVWILLVPACAPTALENQTPTPAQSLTPLPATNPSPTHPTSRPTATTTTGDERWEMVQDALASAFLTPDHTPAQGLCEWEILGQSNREVYVWAMCQTADDPEGMAMSATAVITLDENGKISNIEVPRDGSYYGPDIRKLFPKRVQKVIFAHEIDTEAMWDHIQKRHHTPEPPLIVQSGTPQP